ncbi:hypothetical protein DERF_010368 [Dermatophagoides farinae]|uniref:Uncharacterized protein n=1 Tax=Dermatophagoides farinae TaxID=6954 RepID=A0A922HWW5_DERFA|nr:hypothetical protein DERF_010368 [Dermatophagoides farinae]
MELNKTKQKKIIFQMQKKIKAVMATKMPKKKLKTEKIDAMIIMEKEWMMMVGLKEAHIYEMKNFDYLNLFAILSDPSHHHQILCLKGG